MATQTLTRRLYRSLLLNPKFSQAPKPFSTFNFVSSSSNANSNNSDLNSDTDTDTDADSSDPVPDSSSSQNSTEQRGMFDRPLENGLDSGIYKAILIGQVGQKPLQKKLKSGMTMTHFSLGTGGIRNNRRPLENEDPKEYANRCAVQWHRISVYPERLGGVVMKHLVPGSTVYVEGNLELKIFSDPVTGVVRRVREIAIRRNGRLVFLGKGGDTQPPSPSDVKGVGYM